MYPTPQSVVHIGTIDSSTTVPFLRIGKLPVRVRYIAVCVTVDVGADAANYYKVSVVRISKNGEEEWISRKFLMDTQGMKALVWHELLAEGGMRSDVTWGIKFEEEGAGASLTGVSVAYDMEGRYDGN